MTRKEKRVIDEMSKHCAVCKKRWADRYTADDGRSTRPYVALCWSPAKNKYGNYTHYRHHVWVHG